MINFGVQTKTNINMEPNDLIWAWRRLQILAAQPEPVIPTAVSNLENEPAVQALPSKRDLPQRLPGSPGLVPHATAFY